jgi:hypothetical protein
MTIRRVGALCAALDVPEPAAPFPKTDRRDEFRAGLDAEQT